MTKYSLIFVWTYFRGPMLQEDILSIRWIVNYSRIVNLEHSSPSTLNKIWNRFRYTSMLQHGSILKKMLTYFMISTNVIVLFVCVLIASSSRWTYGMLDLRYLGTEGFSNSYWICRVSFLDATVLVLVCVWLYLAPIMWIFWNCFSCSMASQFPGLIVDDLSRPLNPSIGHW